MAKTDVAVAEEKVTAVVAAADAGVWGDYAGQGMEGTDKDSFAIPFLQLLQKSSPAVDEDAPEYIKGAKAGMLMNSVSKQLFDGKAGVTIIPCSYKRTFIQWGGIESKDSGFKGEFTPEQIESMQQSGIILNIGGRLYKPNADGTVQEKVNDVYVDTRTHFVLIIDAEGNTSQAILNLSSTQVKKSKALMTMLSQNKVTLGDGRKVTPPTFANIVTVHTIPESNDKGSWSGIQFTLAGLIEDKQLFDEAKSFYAAVTSGAVKVDQSKSTDSAEAAAQSDKF